MLSAGQVTCIIPVRDRARMVTRAVASVLAQRTARKLEIIVVDDGSGDDSGQVVAERFPEVSVIRTPHRGPGPARNLGVAAASSELIMFLDSDDQWLPDHVEALLAPMEQGMEMAYGVTCTINELDGGSFLIPDQGRGPRGRCLEALVRWCFLVPSSVAVTRRTFEEAGGFEPLPLGEDWHFFVKVARNHPLGFVPRLVTRRRLHPGSLSAAACRPRAVLGLLRSLRQCLTGDDHGDLIAHLDRAMELAAKEAHQWKTVQDWYNGMRHAGLA